jgi:topoisomerase IV subunit B
MGEQAAWTNTTHDWSKTVDQEHLQLIRNHAADYAATGVQHLVLEVLAYANDEAESLGRRGHCTVTFHRDGSISVADNGRGTDTRRNQRGQLVRKPVMATKDLRFFDQEIAVLPDGRPRRGMSVVAALSIWLEHTNHRVDGAWTQRYEQGVPVADLIDVPASTSTGTTVRFRPDAELVPTEDEESPAYTNFPWLTVELTRG